MALDPKWLTTIDDGRTNQAWDQYDRVIQTEVSAYNAKFQPTPRYTFVDWHLCKAMVWVESGGPSNPAWTKRVLQIGNPGDPAYATLKAGKNSSSLIMSSQLARDIQSKKIDDPTLNIQAGIAYLFTRMAEFAEQSVVDASDKKDHQYVVQPGDSLWRIAGKVGTTVELLKAMNPGAHSILHPKDVLKYRKAKMQNVIVGWRAFSTSNIGTYYNGGGDPAYSAKLDYVLGIFKNLKR